MKLVAVQLVYKNHCLSENIMKNKLILIFFLLFYFNIAKCEEAEKYTLKVVNYAKTSFKQRVILSAREEISEINVSFEDASKIFKNDIKVIEFEMDATVRILKFDRENYSAEAEIIFSRSELILAEGNKQYLFEPNKTYTIKIKGAEYSVYFGEKVIQYSRQKEIIYQLCSVQFDFGWIWVKDIRVGESKKVFKAPVAIPGSNKIEEEQVFTLNNIKHDDSNDQKIANATSNSRKKMEVILAGRLYVAFSVIKNTSEFSLDSGALISEEIVSEELKEGAVEAPDTFHEKQLKSIISIKKLNKFKYFVGK